MLQETVPGTDIVRIADGYVRPKALLEAFATKVPTGVYSQEDVYRMLGYQDPKVLRLFQNSGIEHRHLFVEPHFQPDETSTQLYRRYKDGAVEFGADAIRRVLAGVDVLNVGLLVTVSCTGYLCPGLSAHLMQALDLPHAMERCDILGLGCAGALPGLARAVDYVVAHPGKQALMLAVEICSAAYFVDDSLETALGNAICADGACAILVGSPEGRKGKGWQVLEFFSHVQTQHLPLVGFDFKEGFLKIVLAREIQDLAGPLVKQVVEKFLRSRGLTQDDIRHWIIHPGGRKVIDRIQESLGLGDEDVQVSKDILKEYGNMSSATVLFVADRVARKNISAQTGDLGLMLAMGPGLAVEGALVRWT